MNYLTSLSGSVKCMYSNELADYTYKNFNVYIPYQNKKVFVKSKTESE